MTDKTKLLTREQARGAWSASGLTYADLTIINLRMLRGMIDRAMKRTGFMQGSFRASQRFKVNLEGARPCADLRCHSYYFTDRQAVTFDPGGFIGFAGWADEFNVQPILDAFIKWVAIIRRIKELDAAHASDESMDAGQS